MTGSKGILIVDPSHPDGTAVQCVTKSHTYIDVVKKNQFASQVDQQFTAATSHFIDVVKGEQFANFKFQSLT